MKQAWKWRIQTSASKNKYLATPDKGGAGLEDTIGTTDPALRGIVCAASGVIESLYFTRMSTGLVFTGPGAGNTETWTLYVNGTASALTASVSGSTTAGFDATNHVSVSIGDILTMVRSYSGPDTPPATVSLIGVVFNGNIPLRSMHGANIAPSASSTVYVAPFVGKDATTTRREYRGSNIVGTYGDVTGLYVDCSVAPGVGKSWAVTLVKNGVAVGASTVTVSGTSTTGSSSFSTSVVPVVMTAGVAVSAADELSIQVVPTGSPFVTNVRMRIGIQFEATELEFVNTDTMAVIATIDDNLSNYCINGDFPGGNEYFEDSGLQGSPLTLQTLWPDVGGPDFNVSLAYCGVGLTVGPGTSTSRSFRAQKWDTSLTPDAYADYLPGGNPTPTGSNTFDGTADVGGATQFMTYPATDDGRRFAMRQHPSGSPAATNAFTAFMMFCGSFSATNPTFDGTFTSITPDNGPTSGGTNFTISGSGFQGTVNMGSGNITGVDNITLRGIAATNIVVVNDTTITGTSAQSFTAGTGDVVITFTTSVGSLTATSTLTDGWEYTSSSSWWTTTPNIDTGPIYIYSQSPPSSAYVLAPAPPEPYGWWYSADGLAGEPTVADGTGRPKGVRTIDEVDSFATGAAVHLQGSPGCAVVFRNKLIYAGRDYTVGTDGPQIRIYDGASDRLLTTVPPDASNVQAEAIMSMIVADGTIYLSSLDAAAAGGRVFEFNLDELTLTPLGAAFSGHIPYALCWHMGRLWCGTNDGDGTAATVNFFRPGIDTTWTSDHSTGTETLGGVCSMRSYQGKLYVGTDNVNAANGKIIVRDSLGAYTVSETGTGTSAMNGYYCMVVFQDNLYAGYYNSSMNVTKIRKFDGSSWSTVYTGASHTAIQPLALFTHGDAIYALFGRDDEPAALIYSTTGASSSYVDITAFLSPGNILATPAYGSLRV